MRLYIPMIAAAAALASCGGSPTGEQCSTVPQVLVEPDPVTLQVRDTLTATARFGDICPGTPGVRAGVFFWKSGNSSIVAVDSLSGRVRGVAPGQTSITATDTLDHTLTGTAGVIVTARLNGG